MLKTFKSKKIIRSLASLALIQILFWQAAPASAGLFGGGLTIPSASEVASQLEQRYNLDLGSIRNEGQTFNTIDQKKVNPQVSIFFSPSDPKAGQKITALAQPIYFDNPDDQLYYTWYLKHRGCDLENNVTNAQKLNDCDLNNDGDVTVEDWKIEAMRIYASNFYDYPLAVSQGLYANDNDSDGYDVTQRFGGNDKVNVPAHCYFHDNASGTNYEIAKKTGTQSFTCASGTAACMYNPGIVGPGECDVAASGGSGGGGGGSGSGGSGGSGGSASASCDTFVTSSSNQNLSLAGLPICANGGSSVQCYLGTPCCVQEPASSASSCISAISACSGTSTNASDLECEHLFPNAPSGFTGNGNYGGNEESFWHTNPQDPSTNANGLKDEANLVGVGATKFSWNYQSGDLLGVVVEGRSIVPTKYDDSSTMVMWAFSKNKCSVSNGKTGTLSKQIKGYNVVIPTIEIDLNDCLEDNLADPTVGGQATNLELNVTATPDAPQDDATGKGDGDVIEVAASIDNAAKPLGDTFFDWKVQISSNGTAWTTITGGLQALPNASTILSTTRGNAVNTLRLKMDLKNSDVVNPIGQPGNNQTFGDFLSGNTGYLRFIVDAAENYSSGANRRGNGSVVVKFLVTGDRIQAYLVDVFGNPAKVALNTQEICSGVVIPSDPLDKQALDKLEGKLCRVLSSEIIGLELDNSSGLYSNFSWTLNEKPLICNTKVSSQCFDDRQGNINFFPVVGNPGDTFTIALTANKIATDPRQSSDKTVSLSRTFKIVAPEVQIVSGDLNAAWPKVLGQYKDATGKSFTDFSLNTLEALTGSSIILQANFIPSFLGASFPPKIERSWVVDDQAIGDGASNQITFITNKPDGSIYNVGLAAVYRPGDLIRKALLDIWGISVLDSTEKYFGTASQLEHPSAPEFNETARLQGPQKYLALISSYLPASLLFSIRVMLSMALILFVSGLIFAVSPVMNEERTRPNFRRR